MDKVNLDTIKPWVTKRITELLGMEDEVVTQFIFELLEGSKVRAFLVYRHMDMDT